MVKVEKSETILTLGDGIKKLIDIGEFDGFTEIYCQEHIPDFHNNKIVKDKYIFSGACIYNIKTKTLTSADGDSYSLKDHIRFCESTLTENEKYPKIIEYYLDDDMFEF